MDPERAQRVFEVEGRVRVEHGTAAGTTLADLTEPQQIDMKSSRARHASVRVGKQLMAATEAVEALEKAEAGNIVTSARASCLGFRSRAG